MIDVCTVILHRVATSEEEVTESMEYAGIPTHLQHGLCSYLLHGRRQGDFLMAVLENDLSQAVLRYAGDMNDLHKIILWLTNCVPAPIWGSVAAVAAWELKRKEEGV